MVSVAIAYVGVKYFVARPHLAVVLVLTAPLFCAFYSRSARKLEFAIIYMGLFFSFFYRALRPMVFSNIIWVLIVPAVAFGYLFLATEGRSRFIIRNRLDKLFLSYMIYGCVMTGLGVVLLANPQGVARAFVHAYLPCIFYFISRRYNTSSMPHIKKTLNLIWLLCCLIIADAFVEYYFLKVMGMSNVVPWTARNIEIRISQLPGTLGMDPTIPLRTISILASNKVLSMIVSALCCFVAGFLLLAGGRAKTLKYRSLFQRSNLINGILFGCLLMCSILLNSHASTVSLFVTVCILVAFVKHGKLRAVSLLAILGLICYVFLGDFFIRFYHYRFLVPVMDKGSAVQYIFNLYPVIGEYVTSPLTLVFGKCILQGGGIRGGEMSELRLFVYPVYYGIFWGVLAIFVAITILSYCRRLMALRHSRDALNAIGLAFFGFFLIYFFDVHYPSFDRHGPFELFFVMAGVLSSLYEMAYKRTEYSTAVTGGHVKQNASKLYTSHLPLSPRSELRP